MTNPVKLHGRLARQLVNLRDRTLAQLGTWLLRAGTALVGADDDAKPDAGTGDGAEDASEPAHEAPERRLLDILRSWLHRNHLEVATALVVLTCIAIELLLACTLGALRWRPAAAGILPLLRVAGVCAVLFAAIWASAALSRRDRAGAMTSWWEPGPRPDKAVLEWDEVYRLVAFDRESDPIGFTRTVRRRWWLVALAVQVPLHLAVWGVALSALDLLRNPYPREFLLAPVAGKVTGKAVYAAATAAGAAPRELDKTLAAALGNPAAYIALVVGLATIFFTFRQIRAKVRADSRQAWIVKARELLGTVVAQIDAHQALVDKQGKEDEATKLWDQLNPKRLELELMLNPSEKDHRLLLYLIQRFSAWRDPHFLPQDAQILLDQIVADSPSNILPTKWKTILEARKREDLVSYILRLSHVVLKREWERVKEIQ